MLCQLSDCAVCAIPESRFAIGYASIAICVLAVSCVSSL